MKTIITFLLAIASMLCVNAQPVTFEHSATTENTTNNRTLIDNAAINNDPSAIIAVKKLRKTVDGEVKRNPHEIQTGYDSASGKHYIQNKDNTKAMPIGSCYKVVVISSGTMTGGEVTVTKDNRPFSYVVEIGGLNLDITTKPIATERVNPAIPNTNETPSYLGYNFINTGTWNLISSTSDTFSIGARYNIIDSQEHYIGTHDSAAENIGSYANSGTDFAYWSRMDYESINGNPEAGVYTQLVWEIGISSYSVVIETSTFYNTDVGYWEIHWELENYVDGLIFPTDMKFYVYASNPTLSTSELNVSEVLKVFPNPVKDIFNLESQKPISKITLFNMLGQKIEEVTGNDSNILQMDLSAYSSGNYIAKVDFGNFTKTVKLLKE